jgi:hypothetical protein
MDAHRTALLAAALVGVALGAGGVVAWTRGPSPAADARPAEELRAEMARLREALERETFARQVLEARLSLLERDWDAAGPGPRAPGGAPVLGAEGPPGETVAEGGDPDVAAAGPEQGGAFAAAVEADDPDARPWFDADALVELGMSDGEVERLREIWEQHQLERAYVRTEAIRGGYERSRRHRREQIALEMAFRDELGDETYDRVLYATGRPNRTVVRDVLSQSAGRAAGLEPGDVIWRYDDSLVLLPHELQRATAAGRPGELVPLEVLRDGELERLFVPRGPLGARIQRERISPEAGG